MVFRLNVGFRILVWIFIVAVGELPPVCSAQTADENQAQMRGELSAAQNDLKGLKDSLSLVEKKIDALQASPPLTEEQKTFLKSAGSLIAEFRDIQKKMDETAEHVTGKEMDINNSYFAMLSLVIILASIAVAVFGTFAFFILENVVAKSVTGKVEKEIKERALFETTLGRADTFALLAFAWYEQYAENFQTSLRSGSAPTVLEESELASSFSKRGIATLDQAEFVALNRDDPRVWTARETLFNLLVYNTTVYFLCSRPNRPAPTDDEIASLLAAAQTCLTLAVHPRAKAGHWYELYQTAAFAMIKIGDTRTQRRGRALMLGLLNGDTPGNGFTPPELEWRQELWDDCFATPAGPTDLLDLGQTPKRP